MSRLRGWWGRALLRPTFALPLVAGVWALSTGASVWAWVAGARHWWSIPKMVMESVILIVVAVLVLWAHRLRRFHVRAREMLDLGYQEIRAEAARQRRLMMLDGQWVPLPPAVAEYLDGKDPPT